MTSRLFLPRIKRKGTITFTSRISEKKIYGPRDAVAFSVDKSLTRYEDIDTSQRQDFINNLKTLEDLQHYNPQMLAICYVISRYIKSPGERYEDMTEDDFATRLLRFFNNKPLLIAILARVFDQSTIKTDIRRYEENILRYLNFLIQNNIL